MLSHYNFRQIADVGFGRNRKDSHSLKKTINELCIKNEALGQAHHMFLLFLNLRIYEKNHEIFFCFIFVQGRSLVFLRSKMLIELFIITEKDTLQVSKKMKEKILREKIVDS